MFKNSRMLNIIILYVMFLLRCKCDKWYSEFQIKKKNDAPLWEILRTLQVYPRNHGLDAYQSLFFSKRLQSARVDSCYLLMMFFQPYWLRQLSVKVVFIAGEIHYRG